MSENITILEGGKAENFGQIAKLRTNNGDGYDLWVPEKDVDTKSLSVKKNGLYYTNQYEPTSSEKKDGKAYDIYGWDTITVSVKQKVTGKKKKRKPDGTEIDVPATVEVDDNGNLVEKELPTAIMVITPPRKTGYHAGETIDIAGIVVKAYLEDGTEYAYDPQHNNVIALNELSIEPTTCPSGGSDEYSDGHGLNCIRFNFAYYDRSHNDVYYSTGTQINVHASPTTSDYPDAVYLTKYNGDVYFATSDGGFSSIRMSGNNTTLLIPYNVLTYFTSNAKTEMSFTPEYAELWDIIPTSASSPEGKSTGTLAPANFDVTVTWHRPDDGKALTDTFEIHGLSE